MVGETAALEETAKRVAEAEQHALQAEARRSEAEAGALEQSSASPDENSEHHQAERNSAATQRRTHQPDGAGLKEQIHVFQEQGTTTNDAQHDTGGLRTELDAMTR